MNINHVTHALCRKPAMSLTAGLTTQSVGVPDYSITMRQYQAYLTALRACAVEVTMLAADELFPDGHYVEDTAVLYGDLLVITQPGHSSRRHEPRAIEQALPHQNRVVMNGDAYLDGGDVLFCADRVLIGLSSRTNLAGAEQLRNALCDYDGTLRVDFVSLDGVLHLKTGLTELAPGLLVRSTQFHTDYNFDFAEVVQLPPEEGYSANVLPVNGTLLIAKGYPIVGELGAKYYADVVELDMSEFEKMDGSLTCLSLRYSQL